MVHVDPRNTSRQCSECWHTHRTNRVTQARFVRRSCGIVLHADHNGSRNIRHRADAVWQRGAVNRPRTSSRQFRTQGTTRQPAALHLQSTPYRPSQHARSFKGREVDAYRLRHLGHLARRRDHPHPGRRPLPADRRPAAPRAGPPLRLPTWQRGAVLAVRRFGGTRPRADHRGRVQRAEQPHGLRDVQHPGADPNSSARSARTISSWPGRRSPTRRTRTDPPTPIPTPTPAGRTDRSGPLPRVGRRSRSCSRSRPSCAFWVGRRDK